MGRDNLAEQDKAMAFSSAESTELIVYFIFAYAISWAIGIPLALARQRIIPSLLPAWSHYLVAYGPMLSAVLVTRITRGKSGLKDLYKRLLAWKVRPIW